MEKQNMIRAFKLFDTSGDGKIQPNEFRAALVEQGIQVGSEAFDLAFFLIDEDGSGAIDEREFNKFFMDLALAPRDADYYDLLGNAADVNGDGTISQKEFMRLLAFKGIKIQEEELRRLGKELSKQKFVDYIRKTISLK